MKVGPSRIVRFCPSCEIPIIGTTRCDGAPDLSRWECPECEMVYHAVEAVDGLTFTCSGGPISMRAMKLRAKHIMKTAPKEWLAKLTPEARTKLKEMAK